MVVVVGAVVVVGGVAVVGGIVVTIFGDGVFIVVVDITGVLLVHEQLISSNVRKSCITVNNTLEIIFI